MKVMAIAPYEGLKELMVQLAKQEAFEFEAVSGDLQKGVQLAKEAAVNGTDIIISRGGTAELIQKEVSIPVIDIEVSGYDILRVLTLAKDYPGKAAIVGFSLISEGAAAVCEILDTQIDIFTINDENGAEPLLAKLKDQGYQVIIGDVITIEKAECLGLNGFLLTSGKESVAKAFSNAERLYSFFEKMKEKYAAPYHVLQHAEAGCAIYDEKARPVFINRFFTEQIGALENVEELLKEAEKSGEISFTLRQHELEIMGRRMVVSGETFTVFTAKKMQQVPLPEIPGVTVLLSRHLTPRRAVHIEITKNEQMLRVLKQAELYAAKREPVWISGAKSTGKAALAKLIHLKSPHQHDPFIQIDAGILAEEDWQYIWEQESLLNRNGTLYVKHVHQLSAVSQQILYKLMNSPLCKLRLIVSSSQNMYQFTDSMFVHDLYEALSHFEIQMPSLSVRKEDIKHLGYLYIAESNETFGKQVVGFRNEAIAVLQEAAWPGNLNQLKKAVRHCVLEAEGVYVEKEDVERMLSRFDREIKEDIDLSGTLEEIENRIIQKVYEEEGRNQTRTADRLGINRTTLWRKLKTFDS
ncbi:PrpR N-terminal domain-containing protein [Bacillus atrophaeus]|nr:PrpR N-terminal domain-containing protein [Bacillus atrophaeus]